MHWYDHGWLHQVPNDPPRLLKHLERVLPATLFLETAKELFDDPIFLMEWREKFLHGQATRRCP